MCIFGCVWKLRDSLAGVGLVAGLALVSAGWGSSSARAGALSDENADRLAEQQRPRAAVPFDPKPFDRCVGFYQLGPSVFCTITRQGDHFFSQLTGEQKLEIYQESPAKFFSKVVSAQISFVTDADGNGIELVVHQNGKERHGLRVDESVAKEYIADPEREPPLRRYVEALEKGQADLDDMAPRLVEATKGQWPQIQKSTEGLGALKSLVFTNGDSMGMDVYIASFENREMKFFVGPLNSDHKMEGLYMMPWSAALAEHVKNNAPDPAREPPLRRYVEGLAKGQAYLDDMAPGLVEATKSQWPQIQEMTEGLGGLKSLVFKNVDPMGMDVYLGTFENGEMTFVVGPLNADHKMEGLYLRPRGA
jgi:hypothetical protein